MTETKELRELIEREIRRFYVDRPYEDGLQEATDRITKIVAKALAQARAEGRCEREDEMRATCQKACNESVELRTKLLNQAKSQELLRKEGRAEAIEYARRRINYHMGGRADLTELQVLLIKEMLAFKGFASNSEDKEKK